MGNTLADVSDNPVSMSLRDVANRYGLLKIIILLAVWLFVIQQNHVWIRAVHMVSGFIWWGMVFFINFNLLPAFPKLSSQTKLELLGHVFPRVFRNATTFGFLSVSVGWYFALEYFAFWNFGYFFSSLINFLFFVGISLLTGLYLFHIFLERHEINLLRDVGQGIVTFEEEKVQSLVSHLLRLPRIGFAIQSFAVILMFIH
jgi:hypothetical protein